MNTNEKAAATCHTGTGPDAAYICAETEHHWVSTHVPGLLLRWIIRCSICGTYDVENMNPAILAAADAADREQGIHRVKVDDATVEKVAAVIWGYSPAPCCRTHQVNDFTVNRDAARAVLAALTGGES